MAVTVKTIKYWRGVVEHKPGVLAGILEPMAAAGQNLQVVMGYRMGEGKAAIEVYPVAGKKAVGAARAAGFSIPAVPALLVQGDNQIEFTSLVFLAENIDQFISILLARVSRQVQEFEIQVIEIKSAGGK